MTKERNDTMTNYAVILSGGVGTRMKMGSFPKQYLEVKKKPILIYTLECFQETPEIDRIVIVAAKEWQNQIQEWVKQYRITKFDCFASAGETRQESIRNGLEMCMMTSKNEKDQVIIHDGVRPMVTGELIQSCLGALLEHEGCMPVLPMNDTIYQSSDGKSIDQLLERSTLYAGQAPEAFHLWKYARINRETPERELAEVKGTSEIAYRCGMDVTLIPGDDRNFKITTQSDLERFRSLLGEERE